jgi:hypothetical protein
MRFLKSGVMGCLVGAFLLAACGSDGDGDEGSGTCGAVCSCVVSSGGDSQTCQEECAATVAAGGDQKASCEAKLDGFGYPECKSKCEGFPTG